jgi:hypothetical protein
MINALTYSTYSDFAAGTPICLKMILANEAVTGWPSASVAVG